MKKVLTTSLIAVLALTLMVFTACGGDGAKVGKGGVNLLTFIPDSATAVFTLNFDKIATLDFYDEMIKDAEKQAKDVPGKIFKDYQEFVAKTGIDPKKHVHAVAFAILGAVGPAKPNFVGVANVECDKNKILAVVKEKGTELTTENYQGIDIHIPKEDKEAAVAFLADNVIGFGKLPELKKVIDLTKGTGKNILSNEKMKGYIKNFKSGIVSFVMDIPEDVKKVHDTGMMKVDFSKAEAVLGEVDFVGTALTGEIKVISKNPTGNETLVTAINGMKGMAAMGGPEVKELVDNMNLAATADEISLTFSISKELMDKLKKKAEEKTKGMMGAPTEPTEPTEPPTEDPK